MSAQRLRDRVSVRCSIVNARERVQTYFANWRDSAGITRLRLRVEGVVVAVAGIAPDTGNPQQEMRIRFEPEEAGPYPIFEGTLAIWADEDPKVTFVELDGSYESPGGVVGTPFNAVLGHRLAWRIARTLLLDIARDIADRP